MSAHAHRIFYLQKGRYPDSIPLLSISARYRSDRIPVGPITGRYRFMWNAIWDIVIRATSV